MSTSTGFATSLETFWGNSLQGFYITWEHKAVKETVTATSEMEFTIDLRLFSLGSVLDTTVLPATPSATPEQLEFYFLF
jgi:hypothetical protein